MKTSLKKCGIWIGGGLLFSLGLLVFLFFDGFYGGTHFRTMQDKISSSEQVDLTGLGELQASGGMPPRFTDLKIRLSHINKEKIIVDAIGEFHGYIKGIPTNFLGYARSTPAFRHTLRRLILTGSNEMRPELVKSEAEEARKNGFSYKSFLIGSKFVTDDKTVDEFVAFIDSLPENVWIHFHCAQGRGRTSSMLVMLDVLKNAPKVTLKDIVRRQYLLGAPDLLDTTVWENGSYTQEQLNNRKKFIEDFYTFVCQRKTGGIQVWSEWNRGKKKV